LRLGCLCVSLRWPASAFCVEARFGLSFASTRLDAHASSLNTCTPPHPSSTSTSTSTSTSYPLPHIKDPPPHTSQPPHDRLHRIQDAIRACARYAVQKKAPGARLSRTEPRLIILVIVLRTGEWLCTSNSDGSQGIGAN
jgi:hypothetical protein